jgi:hypothetical protein
MPLEDFHDSEKSGYRKTPVVLNAVRCDELAREPSGVR